MELETLYAPDFKWGGCTDNVRYGSVFTRKFVDSKDKFTRDARAQMNLHNNRAGRKAVRRHLSLDCKCHGVSGSCAVRTCWQRLESFRGIGDFLKRKFDSATEVTLSPDGAGLVVSNAWAAQPPTKGDLVYFEESPDFCEANAE
ncbi:unnamed protein product, partial [Notodromas monacha]